MRAQGGSCFAYVSSVCTFVFFMGCSGDPNPTGPTVPSQSVAQQEQGSLGLLHSTFSCADILEVHVRFSDPGYVDDNKVGLFVLYHGMPPGEKVIRMWWDLEGDPTKYQDIGIGEGEVHRDDDNLFHYEGIIEHVYDVDLKTTFKVRAELILAGRAGCARNRLVTVSPPEKDRPPKPDCPPDGPSMIDQQQPIIDTSSGTVFAIGGGSEQKLAQVVTAGLSGVLTQVRFPISCSSTTELIVEIQEVAGDRPSGVVLTSQTISGADLPPASPTFRSLVFLSPPYLSAGSRFAIVLIARGSCGLYQGPLGDSYPGGDGFSDSRPNPPGIWVPLFYRLDLPFQTMVNPCPGRP
jgi:hypothetical protein